MAEFQVNNEGSYHVIESSGRTTTGGWIKFTNGMAICWGRAYIDINGTNVGTAEDTLPIAFLTNPGMVATAGAPYRASGGATASFVIEIENNGPTGIRVKCLVHSTNNVAAPSVSLSIPYQVIGFWK